MAFLHNRHARTGPRELVVDQLHANHEQRKHGDEGLPAGFTGGAKRHGSRLLREPIGLLCWVQGNISGGICHAADRRVAEFPALALAPLNPVAESVRPVMERRSAFRADVRPGAFGDLGLLGAPLSCLLGYPILPLADSIPASAVPRAGDAVFALGRAPVFADRAASHGVSRLMASGCAMIFSCKAFPFTERGAKWRVSRVAVGGGAIPTSPPATGAGTPWTYEAHATCCSNTISEKM